MVKQCMSGERSSPSVMRSTKLAVYDCCEAGYIHSGRVPHKLAPVAKRFIGRYEEQLSGSTELNQFLLQTMLAF